MSKLIMFLVSSVFGSVGWWLGGFINIDCAFLLSTIASIAGIFYGWKWGRAFC
jgi:hypothetical protein